MTTKIRLHQKYVVIFLILLSTGLIGLSIYAFRPPHISILPLRVGEAEKTAVYAAEKNDPAICARIFVLLPFLGFLGPTTENQRAVCFVEVARLLNDESVCDLMYGKPYDQSDHCVFDIAQKKGELAVCDKLRNAGLKGMCYEWVIRESGSFDKTPCLTLEPETARERCLEGFEYPPYQ